MGVEHMQTLNRNRMYYTNQQGKFGNRDFNCWGATLFVLGHNNRLYWEDSSTMQRWLDTYTIQIAKPTNPGDIVAVHSRWEGLEHTGVYIGRGRYFHKRGSNEAEIVTLEEMKYIYEGVYTYRRLKV